ncbi:DUF3466 family protein [Shewanella sp. OMA3-2]|uniref:DUF3466 family protein n=1 Tax=Shewanella sp. OMA3-2 TaxID=2908650 RepID=UPI001F409652|nr:DUF3466 family protein [Shewanella sp. OMA3-2]UJF23202.1 DUF3466 family protein [Shewanella sp. OMA3-2]
MKLKLDRALSLVAISVLSVIGSAQAAPVYEIVNLDEATYDLRGTLTGTRAGYALGVDNNDELVGISKGKKKLNTEDIEGGIIDVEDGIAPAEQISYSIYKPIEANNFTFTAAANAAEAWKPTFFSIAGTTAPDALDAEGKQVVNSVDSYLYGMNSSGIKVGAFSAPEQKIVYQGTLEDQDYWYIRDFELRGVAVKSNESPAVELPLVPPYTTFTREANGDKPAATVELGGWSSASAVNDSNIVTGYGSTGLASFSKDRVNLCIDNYNPEAENPLPIDICVQAEQYPVNNRRNIQYQTRALVWDLNNIDAEGKPLVTELPLGLTPGDSTLVFTAQGLGINSQADIVGRSHVYRNGDTNNLRQDAAFWKKDANGVYQYNWVDFKDNDILSSALYDVNDDGLMVGNYRKYIGGYLRDKFFIFDSNNTTELPITPEDFNLGLSDLSSKAKGINNKGQVVGHIEVTYDKEKPRPKAGFLYNHADKEFLNINNLLVCESKGYEAAGDSWARRKITIQDGTGEELTYDSEFYVVEANNINEDGTIVGTAFIRKPQYQFDIFGNLIINEENGLPYFALDGNGNPVTSYLPRMVVLKPTSGEACTYTDVPEEKPYERKGAASFAWLFALPLLWLRRRTVKSAS